MIMGLLFILLQTGRPHNLQLVSYEHPFQGMWSNRLTSCLIEKFPLLRYLRHLLIEPNPLRLSPLFE